MGLIQQFTGSYGKKQNQKALSAAEQGESSAIGAIQSGANEAKQAYTPWMNQGGQNAYLATLGLKGPQAQEEAWGRYLNDPVGRMSRQMDAKNLSWAFNSRGGYGAGAHALADSANNYKHAGAYQNRLAGVGGQEFDATQGYANAATGAGNAMANTYMGGANTKANILGKMGEPIFANNVIGGAAALGSFFGGGGGGKEKGGSVNNLLKFFTG
jgi:hypothetical protein